MTRMIGGLLILSLLTSSLALGQTMAERGPKSETAALVWSLGGTLVPAAAGGVFLAFGSRSQGREGSEAVPILLLIAGPLIGPSLGHMYAGRTGRGLATIGLRAALSAGGLVAALAICPFDGCSTDESAQAGTVFLAAAGLVAASIVYDVVTAPASARWYNARHRSASFRPTFINGRPGLAARLSYRI